MKTSTKLLALLLSVILLVMSLPLSSYALLTGTYDESVDEVEANGNGASVTNTFDPATNRLTGIASGSTAYTFTYDPFGNTKEIAAGNYTLVSYTSNPNNGKVLTQTYGGTDENGNPVGLVIKYVYDHLDRVSEIQYNIGENNTFVTVVSYTYDAKGNLNHVTDHQEQQATHYRYDGRGQLTQTYTYDLTTNKIINASNMQYDLDGKLTDMSLGLDYTHSTSATASRQLEHSYTYNSLGAVELMTVSDGIGALRAETYYDSLGRLSNDDVEIVRNGTTKIRALNYYFYGTYDDSYPYQTSGLVSMLTSRMMVGNSERQFTQYTYTYDDFGNLTQVNDSTGVLCRYVYDSLGQLVREDNRLLSKSYTYTYDNAGNITAKKTYAYTIGTLGSATSTQTYGYTNPTWGDLLTSINGEPVTYDAIGNPLQIGTIDLSGGGNDGRIFEWEGRLLTQVNYFQCHEDLLDEYPIGIYTYNADGIRTSKTDMNGVTHEYILNGSQIVAEKWTQNGVEHMMVFLYDENGAPVGLRYRNSTYSQNVIDYYLYEKNLQGDIIGIFTETGTKICTYKYDAWGNVTTQFHSFTDAHMLIIQGNPFRYRGYYYDTETGYYYLQSRYYVPQWGRFLTADDASVITATPEGFTDKNLIIYCDNNPVTRVDEDGDFWNVIAGAVVGGVVSFASSVVSDIVEDGAKNIKWGKAFASAGIGAAAGALTAALPGAGVLISAASSAVDSITSDLLSKEKVGTRDMLVNATVSAGIGAVTGTWGNSFANTNIYDDAAKAFFKRGKGNHPIVKKAAKKAISKAGKHLARSYASSQIEGLSMNGISLGTSWWINSYIDSVAER